MAPAMAGNHAQTVMMATILTLTTSSQVIRLRCCHYVGVFSVCNWLVV